MTEMYSEERPEVMYAHDMNDSRHGSKDEVFGGVVVSHDQTNREHRYALVEADLPQNGQKLFRLYEGRYCRFVPTADWPRRNHSFAGIPAVGERITFALKPDCFRADARFISAGGPEVQYLSARKGFRLFGNTNHRYRLAEASDLMPGAELLMVKYNRLSPGDDPAHHLTFTIRLTGSPDDGYVRYNIIAPEVHAYEGCFVRKEEFLCLSQHPYYDDDERVAFILPLAAGEVTRPGCVCTGCGQWVAEGDYHSHYSSIRTA